MKEILIVVLALFYVFAESAIIHGQENKSKSDWYIGFGIGSGRDFAEGDSFQKIYKDWGDDAEVRINKDSSYPVAINFGLGLILNPYFHSGLDISAIRQQCEYKYGGWDGTAAMQINNYLAVIKYYPIETGFSLKGGFGLAAFYVSTEGDIFDDESEEYYGGKAFLFGAGYDFPLGDTFNLGIHAEYSKQTYSGNKAPSYTEFFNIYISFYWF